ncbi:hypothetical protein DL96DRAFT_1622734 [Flagelloscypha sp. PMI_526]|nr:hypothetical protein DL96DRAFT_1622734 [Flagelloscypha sp. PMI_526]
MTHRLLFFSIDYDGPLTGFTWEENKCELIVTYSLEGMDRDPPPTRLSIAEALSTPSQDAHHAVMRTLQQPRNPAAIYNGRPSALKGPPLSIYFPPFHSFQLKLLDIPSDFDEDDLYHARGFVNVCRAYHQDDAHRRDALWPHLGHFLGEMPLGSPPRRGLTRPFTLGGFKSAPTWFGAHSRYKTEIGFHEDQLDIGSTQFNALDRGDKAYTQLCLKEDEPMKTLRKSTCRPAYILSMMGRYLQIGGAIWLGVPVTAPLTDLISLVGVQPVSQLPPGCPSADEYLVWRIAHLFHHLGKLAVSLEEYYSKPPREPHPLNPAPAFGSFTGTDTRKYSLVYTGNAIDYLSHRAAFYAVATSNADIASESSSKEVVVKFTSHYCVEAHKILAHEGIAPALLYCTYEESIGLWVIITPRLLYETYQLSEEGYEKLKSGITTLHAKDFVYGDLRPPNVFLQADGLPLLIDFDWCGKKGEARYPTDLAQGVGFREEAEGSLITEEDDLRMLEELRKVFV